MAEQNRTSLDWEDLRVFLALARHGSLSAAARALSVNHATVARRIRSLEASFNQKLVDRRPDGYILTPAGTRAVAAASDMEAAAGSLGRHNHGDTPTGLVRVNAPPAIALSYLGQRLAKLPAQYPGLDIDFATDMRPVSLERHETDVAVRLGRPPDAHLLARKLVTVRFGFYGTVAVCRRIESGGAPVFISFDEANSQLPEALWLARYFPKARVSFRADNQFGQAGAARAGCGVALLPHYIGRSAQGLRLCALSPLPPARDLWLLTRPQSRNDVAIRTVIDHLTQLFAQDRELFESEPAR